MKASEIIALATAGYTAEQISGLGFAAAVPSFVFVTIGNILGGALLGAAFWYIHREKHQ